MPPRFLRRITAPLAEPASVLLGGVEALVRKQLEIMEKQLELLRNPAAAGAIPAASASQPVIATPIPTPACRRASDAFSRREHKCQEAGDACVRSLQASAKRSGRCAAGQQQQKALDALIARYTTLTKESKRLTAEHRAHFADPRTVSGFRQMWKEMVYPIVTERSQGSRLWDVDGNEYVDMTNGFGSILFGHRPDFVVRAVSEQMAKGFEIGPQSPWREKLLSCFAG